uniref:hypothetical protein n=1 Tax=Pantoea sp. ME81 TaxID=2743935 RepID=UPI002104E5DA
MIWRWFWREWRSPSLLIVWLALTLAVACVLALGSISDRMEKGLSQQSRDFMAGDRTLRSSAPAPEAWPDRKGQSRNSGPIRKPAYPPLLVERKINIEPTLSYI